MPSIDLSDLDFAQVIAVLVIAFCLKVASDLISEHNRRRRLASDVDLIERLSLLDLSSEERRVLDSFRSQTVRELPIKQVGTQGTGVTPTTIISALWFLIILVMVFTGVTWAQLLLVAVGLVLSVRVAKFSYEMGQADGSLRERENFISANRPENDSPEKVDEREQSNRY